MELFTFPEVPLPEKGHLVKYELQAHNILSVFPYTKKCIFIYDQFVSE